MKCLAMTWEKVNGETCHKLTKFEICRQLFLYDLCILTLVFCIYKSHILGFTFRRQIMQGIPCFTPDLSILAALPLAVMSWPHVVFVSDSAGPAPAWEFLPLWIGRHWRIHCWWRRACRRKRWIWAESFGLGLMRMEIFSKTGSPGDSSRDRTSSPN